MPKITNSNEYPPVTEVKENDVLLGVQDGEVRQFPTGLVGGGGGGGGEVWDDITENFEIAPPQGEIASQAIGIVPDDAFIRIHYTQQVENEYYTRGTLISPPFKCVIGEMLLIPSDVGLANGRIMAFRNSSTSYTIHIQLNAPVSGGQPDNNKNREVNLK